MANDNVVEEFTKLGTTETAFDRCINPVKGKLFSMYKTIRKRSWILFLPTPLPNIMLKLFALIRIP